MTSAALTLLHHLPGAIWPWADARHGVVAEAFPAVQLRHWQLPHQGYAKPDQGDVREVIIRALEERRRLRLGVFRDKALESSDALDAVLAAFAGIGVADGALAEPASPISQVEGWIAVHR